MKRTLSLMLGFCLVSAAWAQEQGQKEEARRPTTQSAADAELLDILKKVDEAAKKVQSARYKVELKAWGAIGSQEVPEVKGTVALAGKPRGQSNDPDTFRMQIKGEGGPRGKPIDATIGGDGNEYYRLDPATKTAHIDVDPNVVGPTYLGLARWLAMMEFVHPTPFSDEIRGDKREKRPDEKIGDQECWQIHVVYSGGEGQSTWWFSKKDYLPRQVKRFASQGGGYITTVLDLEVDPKLDKSFFKPQVPEGWTKTDEPAP